MKSSFQFVALEHEQFQPLFTMTDDELVARGVIRTVVDETPGYPCRVTLADAKPGERVLLLRFTHHDVDSPYRASGPIYVREDATTVRPEAGEIPVMFHHRLLSIRAYDAAAMLVSAAVVDGSELEGAVRDHLAGEKVRYLHVHNAGPGCYNARVLRVG